MITNYCSNVKLFEKFYFSEDLSFFCQKKYFIIGNDTTLIKFVKMSFALCKTVIGEKFNFLITKNFKF